MIPQNKIHRRRPILGTYITITVEGLDEESAHPLITQAFSLIEEIDREASFFRPGNWLHSLNEKMNPDAFTWSENLLAITRDLFKNSHGSFCPFTNNKLDLGGIAKGYAVDQAVDFLKAAGVKQGLVNAGGDLRAFGPRLQKIPIASPLSPQPLAEIELIEGALATSLTKPQSLQNASRERFASRGISTSANETLISVVAPTCALADGLTKVVAGLGSQKGEVLNKYSARAIVFDMASQNPAEVIGW
ncbi:MAG: FAD:protein FMN transferase [Bdellovibrionales bacterium]